MTLAVAKIQMTPELYRQQYADWLVAVSRWAKWAPHIAIGLSAIGVALLVLRPDFIPSVLVSGWFFTLLGPFEYASHLRNRNKWLKGANDSKVAGQWVEIRFEDDAIYLKGPTSESRTEWHGFERAIAAPSGLFLYTDKGVHIYVPDYALDVPGAKPSIMQRLQAAQ